MPFKAILLGLVAAAFCLSCTRRGLEAMRDGRGGSAQIGGASGADGGTGGVSATGGRVATGGATATGGSSQTGGMSATGGTSATGGQSGAGGASTTGGMGGSAGDGGASGGHAGSGTGGATSNARGPCDVYQEAGQPCVAAYSTVRRLLSTYAGPLYQIRSGSSNENTGSGGETHDIGQTADGFADAAAVDAACAGTICTVSLLYDQSGKGSHLSVAKKGPQSAGPTAPLDDFESSATGESLMVGGHKVYSLYMEPRQGYRLPRLGDGIPRAMEPQSIYMLADGTRAGVGCCWDFGNSPPTTTSFAATNALFYGSGHVNPDTRATVVGAGDGPWFMWNEDTFVWAGGSTAVDPALLNNPNNPSLAVKFALGFLKTDPRVPMPSAWALRMADVTSATAVTTAYEGVFPRPLYNGGSVVLGIDAHNANASWGTFYEGAIVAGFAADETELAVLQNIQAVGYGR